MKPVPAASAEIALRVTTRDYLGARVHWWGSDPAAGAVGLYYSGPWRNKYLEVGVAVTSSQFDGQDRILRGALAFGAGWLIDRGHRVQLALGVNVVRDPRHPFASGGVTLWFGDFPRAPDRSRASPIP